MARDDRGIAWTALSLVEDDLDAGRLVRAGTAEHDVPIEIRLWRPKARQAGRRAAVDEGSQVRGELERPGVLMRGRVSNDLIPALARVRGVRLSRSATVVRRGPGNPAPAASGITQEISMQHPMRVPGGPRALSPRQAQISVKMGRFGTADASNLMKTVLNYPEFARSIGLDLDARDADGRPAASAVPTGLHADGVAVRQRVPLGPASPGVPEAGRHRRRTARGRGRRRRAGSAWTDWSSRRSTRCTTTTI